MKPMPMLVKSLVEGLRTAPRRLGRCVLLAAVFGGTATVLGSWGGVFRPERLNSPLAWILPFTMFVFPSLLEESVFRGLLIPHPHTNPSRFRVVAAVVMSTIVFTAWHPLNAWLLNPGGRAFFYDPWFLAIVALLGLTCGITYVISRSLWVPVVIHWGTVLIWVFLLGGRNLVKAAGE